MRVVEKIVVHCAATPNGRAFSIADIDGWHRERNFRRAESARAKHRPELTSVGYHFVILHDGRVELGRHTEEAGAHVAGHNARTIGICMMGTDKYTRNQWESLALLIQSLFSMYPLATVCGHRDFPGVKKSCPGFDAGEYAKTFEPKPENILEVA